MALLICFLFHFPIFEHLFYRALLFIILIGFISYSNVTGVKQSMKVAKVLTLMKLLPMVLIVVIGLFQLNFHNLSWNGLPSAETIGSASLLLFAAFLGGETAATLGGEMKNPKRTGPLGILTGVISVIIFYILVHVVAQSSLGTIARNTESATCGSSKCGVGTLGFAVVAYLRYHLHFWQFVFGPYGFFTGNVCRRVQ